MNKSGVTLIELIVVVTIIGILAVALGFSYIGWQNAYKVERATKDIYSDLMDARGRAMARGLTYFVDFNTPAPPAGQGRYRTIEDTNGNLVNDDPVLPSFPKTIEYVINWGGAPAAIGFDRGGIISTPGTICLTTTADSDYDCIEVMQTRINIGKLITQISKEGACAAANCIAR
jgi:prepilin-type N-terminal cleavage/methylation domain-containing protein